MDCMGCIQVVSVKLNLENWWVTTMPTQLPVLASKIWAIRQRPRFWMGIFMDFWGGGCWWPSSLSVYPRHQYMSSQYVMFGRRDGDLHLFIYMFFQVFLVMKLCHVHTWKNKKTSKGTSPKQTNIKQLLNFMDTIWTRCGFWLWWVPGDALPWVLSCPTRSWRSRMSISGAALVIQWLGPKGENGKPQTSEGNPTHQKFSMCKRKGWRMLLDSNSKEVLEVQWF